jgi:GDP-4-dehydro-6-deoxy-D-mannose reductase
MAASRPACAPISVRLGNIDTERDFLSIDDAVGAYVDLLRGDYWGEIFNICSGEPVPIRRILEKLVAMAPGPIRIESDPARFRTSDPPRVYGSLAKAREAFGFHPTTSLDESLFAAWKEHMSEATRCA